MTHEILLLRFKSKPLKDPENREARDLVFHLLDERLKRIEELEWHNKVLKQRNTTLEQQLEGKYWRQRG